MTINYTQKKLLKAIDYIDEQLYELGANGDERNDQIEAVDYIKGFIINQEK